MVDYVKRLNAASKEITVLAAKLSVPLKEAQQKLVAFMIEFLRIWPSKLGSKYKQIDKELNIGKSADTRTQDRYIIMQDERPELDAWKGRVNSSVKDNDVRMFGRKLKTKEYVLFVCGLANKVVFHAGMLRPTHQSLRFFL